MEPWRAVREINAYMGPSGVNYTDEEIEEAFAAESQLQAQACRGNYTTNPVLWQALRRRVHRNLAMRALPLGVQPTGDGGYLRPSLDDPEVRRLERPFRKVIVG